MLQNISSGHTVFKMNNENTKKEVKQIVYLLAFVWILNILIWGYLYYAGIISFQIIQVINFLPLILIPIVMAGLWSMKKWGLILGYIFSILLLLNSIISLNALGLIIWGVILRYLHKYRKNFS